MRFLSADAQNRLDVPPALVLSSTLTISSSPAEGFFYRILFTMDEVSAARTHADVERAVVVWVRRTDRFNIKMRKEEKNLPRANF